jgi:hypothetical protein
MCLAVGEARLVDRLAALEAHVAAARRQGLNPECRRPLASCGSPRRRLAQEPDDDDLDFILAQCDADHDGKISREECVAAIGLWVRIVNQTEVARHESGACVLM